MEAQIVFITMLLVIGITGGFYFLFPRISRKGLLFGVYVGEEASSSEEARQITRSWYWGMTFWLVLSIAVATLAAVLIKPVPAGSIGAVFLLLVIALGGSIFIALKYGQGGSRLEQGAGDTPLTDGLADNRLWVLGMFYVNKDDPSMFVERRFGFGYTINFGNPKAVMFFVGFIGLVILISVIAILTN